MQVSTANSVNGNSFNSEGTASMTLLDTPPASETGFKCDPSGKTCVAWVQVTVKGFEHVKGITDPPCASNPQEAVASIGTAVVTGAIAVGYTVGGVPGAIAGGIVGGGIAALGSPGTPLGQLLNPPSNKARCQVVAVVIPPNAKMTGASLWVSNTQGRIVGGKLQKGLGPVSIGPGTSGPSAGPNPLRRVGGHLAFERVDAGQDVTYAKFVAAPQQKKLTKDGKPVAIMVWTIFKNWSGNLDRTAAMNVEFQQP
jgi:hypothetical protein